MWLRVKVGNHGEAESALQLADTIRDVRTRVSRNAHEAPDHTYELDILVVRN